MKLFVTYTLIILSYINVNSQNNERVIERLKEVLSLKYKNIPSSYTDAIKSQTIKYCNFFNNDTVVFIQIDTLIQDGNVLTVGDIEVTNLISILNGDKSKVIINSETQKKTHFEYVGRVNYEEDFSVFYHISSPVGWIKYYFLDEKTTTFYKTIPFEYNVLIDYFSINFNMKDYYYYSEKENAKMKGVLFNMDNIPDQR